MRCVSRHPEGKVQTGMKHQIRAALAKPVAAAILGAFPFLAGCATTPADNAMLPLQEHVQSVPGFADFIAIDGASVWVTNRGRVERWSQAGKMAEVTIAHPCGAMAIAYGSLWVADCASRTLDRVDLKTSTVSAVIATGLANPRGETNVVAGAGSIWVASNRGVISRIDPATNQVAAQISVDPDAYYLSYGLGALWATSPTRQTLEKIDPATNTAVASVTLGRQPGFLVAGEGAVWVQEQGDGTVARVDPQSVKVTARLPVGETLKYGDIDAGGGKVWLRTTLGQTVVAIDPKQATILARIGKATGSGALRYAPGGLWTTSHDVHTLSWWSGL